MRYEILDAQGAVVNTVVADAAWIAANVAPGRWQLAAVQAPALVPPVPQSVSRFQGRAALLAAGLFDDVEAYMALGTTDPYQRLAWQDAQEFERGSATVAALAALLGLTSEQLDSLFITASGIRA